MNKNKIELFINTFINNSDFLSVTQKEVYLKVANQRLDTIKNSENINLFTIDFEKNVSVELTNSIKDISFAKAFLTTLVKEEQLDAALFYLCCFEVIILIERSSALPNNSVNPFIYQIH